MFLQKLDRTEPANINVMRFLLLTLTAVILLLLGTHAIEVDILGSWNASDEDRANVILTLNDVATTHSDFIGELDAREMVMIRDSAVLHLGTHQLVVFGDSRDGLPSRSATDTIFGVIANVTAEMSGIVTFVWCRS